MSLLVMESLKSLLSTLVAETLTKEFSLKSARGRLKEALSSLEWLPETRESTKSGVKGLKTT